jgi:hypothetical protein
MRPSARAFAASAGMICEILSDPPASRGFPMAARWRAAEALGIGR